MLQLNIVFISSALFALSESASIVEKLGGQCSISDESCLTALFKTVTDELAEHGIPEMDIPNLDPLEIKDRQIDVFGMITITMKEGVAKGFNNCYAKRMKADITKLRVTADFVCDLFSIDGSYKIESTPTLLALIGGINIHGDGNGGIFFEKIHLTLDIAFEVKKLDDGELHLQIIPDDSTPDFEVTGKTTVSADNVFIGNQEISTVAVNIINENWEFLVKTIGTPIVDKALEEIYPHAQKFLNTVPAKDLISDDLSSYVKS